MSKNKHKKKTKVPHDGVGHLDTTNLNREMAREVIGQVKPTSFIPSRARGTGSRRSSPRMADPVPLDLTKEIHEATDIDEFIRLRDHKQEHLEPFVKQSNINAVVKADRNIREGKKYFPDRRQREYWASGVQTFSPEALAHINFLRESEGEEAANRYLKLEHERRKQMSTGAVMTTSGANGQDLQPNSNTTSTFGPIEKALDEAAEKAKFYARQALEAKQEEQRWTMISNNLRDTLRLVTAPKDRIAVPTTRGEVTPPAIPGERFMTPSGWANDVFTKILSDAGGHTTFKKLRDGYLAAYKEAFNREAKTSSFYPAVATAIDRGVVTRNGEDVSLGSGQAQPQQASQQAAQ